MTFIYSSEVSTNILNYKSQKSIKIFKKKIKCYLHNASWVFEFSYKLLLAQNMQLCLGTLTQFHLTRWADIEPGT